MMDSIKMLRIRYENIRLFHEGRFEFSFMAEDRVSDPTQVFQLRKNLYTQKLIALAGINASGKTSALKLIYLALSILLERRSLNEISYGKEFLQDGTRIILHFCYRDMRYELRSVIGKTKSSHMELYFNEEFLFTKTLASMKSKKDILHFDDTQPMMRRSKLPSATLDFLKNDDSMITGIIRSLPPSLYSLINAASINFLRQRGSSPTEILNVFDPTLDELTASGSNDDVTYTVKFKNDPRPISSTNVWRINNLVSSGTIKGQNIMMLVESVLQTGGYLIIDELENHMNKELVRMITDIFKNERINKHGACLIFSTHYAEILDFMDRKDNIYITRRNQTDASIELLNYASEVKRNDVKKSDVILSNYIEGTTPSYESIQALEDYLCSKMD